MDGVAAQLLRVHSKEGVKYIKEAASFNFIKPI